MKYIYIIIFLLLNTGFYQCVAQNSEYVIIDSTYRQGQVEYDLSNPYQITYNEKQTLTASEVKEFVLKDGRKFVSFLITTDEIEQSVFLEELEVGEVGLYYLRSRKQFFIKTDRLIQLQKSTFRVQLGELEWNCPNKNQSLKPVRFNLNSLSYFIQKVNNKKCFSMPFSHYGVSFGVGRELFPGSDHSAPVSTKGYNLSSKSYVLGLYAEMPIWTNKQLSTFHEIKYARSSFIGNRTLNSSEQDIKIDFSNLNYNGAIKYVFQRKAISPYIWIGTSASYTLSSSSEMFEANFINETETTSSTEQTIYFDTYADYVQLPTFNVGISSGLGVQWLLTPKHYVAFELSGVHYFNSNNLPISGLFFNTRINL